MSKEQFKYEEAQNGILWKSHYGDIFKCADKDCLAQIKVIDHINKKRQYFIALKRHRLLRMILLLNRILI